MKHIRGPKSALSDFIQESNIKIGNKRTIDSTLNSQIIKPKRKQKTAKYEKPYELVNQQTKETALNDKKIEDLLAKIDSIALNDDILNTVSMYLSRKRKMSKAFFDFLVDKCSSNLSIYDCSMIKDIDVVICKQLKKLELYQCGQLTEDTLNCILSQMEGLEELRITGAFLLETFNVPSNLKLLDVSNCSRLKDVFINNINNVFTRIKELRISFCYGFTVESQLTCEVENLFLCETRLSENFYSKIKNLEKLSIKRCINIDTLINIKTLQYLDVEGIVTLTHIPPSKKLLHLNIADCVQIKDLEFPYLTYLNMANTEINQDHINKILQMHSLEELDISWNSFIDDQVLEQFLKKLQLKKIYVFGCFSLSKQSVEFAYQNKAQCHVIGNPYETRYLLDETLDQ